MQLRQLRDYQYTAFKFACQRDHSGLFLKMRMGKSLIALRLSRYWNAKRVLIVCPLSSFFGWKEEIQKEGLNKVNVIYGSQQQRIDTLRTFNLFSRVTCQYYLLNWEGWKVVPDICNKNWDLIITDESTYIRNINAKITQYFIDNFRDIPHRLLLTGTPAPETPLEYFTQCKFLDSEIFDEKNFYQFRFNNFGLFENNPHKWYLSSRGREYISSRLSRSCIFMDYKDAGISIGKVKEVRMVEMSSVMRKAYKSVAEDFLLIIENKLINSTIFSTTQYIWLKRLCGGIIDGKLVFDDKIKELIYLLSTELKAESAVVWCCFVEELKFVFDLCKNKFKTGLIYGNISQKEREKILLSFTQGELSLLIAQPGCFKFGVDLSIATTMIYYSSPESALIRQQSEARADKVNSKKSTLILDLVTKDSIEQSIMVSLRNKESQQQLVERIVRDLQIITKERCVCD